MAMILSAWARDSLPRVTAALTFAVASFTTAAISLAGSIPAEEAIWARLSPSARADLRSDRAMWRADATTASSPPVPSVAALAAALLPFAGHAAAADPPAGAEFADALHVLSAAMWAGGILALATLRPPGGWQGPEARALLERFAGVALVAFAVTALTGVLRATEQLHALSDLWTTTYGIVLALKSAGVGVMLVLSLAWRRGLPVARFEAGVAALVVGATAILASFPNPE